MNIFIDLLQNIALLLAIAVVFDLTAQRWRRKELSLEQIPAGLVIGLIGITLMLTPWTFEEGIIFDTRSVLLSISGVFFGLIPTAIAMLMTIAFRFYQGGAAALTGSIVIFCTGSLGILWHYIRKGSRADIPWYEFYLFGLMIHVVMLLCMLTLPQETAFRVLYSISLPVLLIYPIGTTLLGLILSLRLRRQQINEALRASEERLRLAIDASNVGFLEFDLKTQEFHLSPEALKQLGYTPEVMMGNVEEWLHQIHPDDLPAVQAVLTEIMQVQKTEFDLEFRLRHKDGTYRWLLTHSMIQKDERELPVKLLGSSIDITRRKENEAVLSASERRFRSLAESSQDYIMLYDREGRHIYENPAGLKVAGMTAEDIIGKTHREAGFGEELSNLWEGDIANVFNTGSGTQRLFEWGSAEGTAFLDWRLSPVFNEQGEVELVLGISRDITALKKAEAEIVSAQTELKRLLLEADQSRRALLSLVEDQMRVEAEIRKLNAELEQRVKDRTARLEAANHELEAFAYSVSHDLRAPLRALDGFSTELLDSYSDQLDEQGKHYLRRIKEASNRMSDLINDILNLSRVSRAQLISQQVDLSQLARESAKELQALYSETPIEFNIAPSLPVQGDANLLRLVIENLVSNACKFSSRSPHPQVSVDMVQQGENLVYYVKDNGTGFDMAYVDKLFVPFQRLHRNNEYPGTGIGLVIVQRIITRHGGRVWTEASPGNGATFYFTLGEL